MALAAGCFSKPQLTPADGRLAVDGQVTDGSLVIDGPTLDGPALDGPALDGPALDGPTLDGPALDGPALDGPALDAPPIDAALDAALDAPPIDAPTSCTPALGCSQQVKLAQSWGSVPASTSTTYDVVVPLPIGVGQIDPLVRTYQTTLQVSDESGAVLAFELESTSGMAQVIWVHVPALRRDGGTTLTVRYGKGPIVSILNPAWAGHLGVWHLADGAAVTQHSADAGAGSIDATASGAPTAVSGALGGATSFPAVADFLTVTPPAALTTTQAYTVSCWVRPAAVAAATDWAAAIQQAGASASVDTLYLGMHGTIPLGNSADSTAHELGDTAGNVIVPAKTWTHLTFVSTKAADVLYVDGVVAATNTHSPTAAPILTATALHFGNKGPWSAGLSSTDPLRGALDEVRIELGGQAADQVMVEHLAQANKLALYGAVTSP